MSVCFIGHVAKDVVEGTSPVSYEPGGGVFYGGLALAEVGQSISILTKTAAADQRLYQQLAEKGSVTFLSSLNSTTFENRYPDGKPDNRISFVSARAASFTAEDLSCLPQPFPSLVVVVSPLCGEFPAELLRTLQDRHHSHVALDVQGFTRSVGPDGRVTQTDWPEKAQWLPYISLLKIDNKEGLLLTGKADLKEACAELIRHNPQMAIVATSAEGVLFSLCSSDGTLHSEWRPWAPPRTPASRTGRGDTTLAFFSHFYLSRGLPLADAATLTAIFTEAKMQVRGPFNGEALSLVRETLRKRAISEDVLEGL
ncbi:putative carbohydrate kinase [Paratrimastix pyriformis]|uniref:Carbohydrate kinase n=1 Tax=Paratrimastix pyriformis TaxID=342808 RepID=A0ABQ8UG24_9EUKA|nr:putative carbohydrate kinase [Paratrimastix pyriformis]